MSWKPEVEELAAKREAATQLGGEEAVARQHERGRLTVRERVAALVDAESFYEQGPVAGHTERDEEGRPVAFRPANYVLGLARIEGRPVVVGGEDFTQRGGSPSPAGLRKSVYAEELALQHRLPLVRFLEGGGGSVTGGGKGASAPVGNPVFAPHRFDSIARVLATAPVVSAAVGAVAGFPAARLAASHLAIMTRDTAQVMIGGPALVERALGEELTKEELGGARVHARSGVVDVVAEDEADAVDHMRRFLGYLPTNVFECPPVAASADDRERAEEALLSIVPRERRRVYDMRRVIRHVVDRESFYELTAGYGRSQITGLARLDGRPVGVWGNDCRFHGGAMDAEGAQKARRFVDFCDTFHLPVVCFVDEPGFMIGSGAERTATIRYGVAAIAAVVQSQTPWASVLVRKAYGVAAAAHFGPSATVFAWPSAESGALPIEGGVAVAFRREIAAAPDPEARRAELEEEFSRRRSPFPRAESFSVHDLIDPRETRSALNRWLDWAWPQLASQCGSRAYTFRP
ncbi:MAG: propionyl-CoA carboxylase [Proteobacteria bacterium]|nr:propionyl-CoA carboxylase [Pseudomonadota bacterium]